jgi:death on curing protein
VTEGIVYLDVDDLLAAAVAALWGRQPEVRDFGLLESAAHRPQATVFGQDAYPTIDAKAAALLHSLVRNHALVDVNKRLAWVAARLFYGMNEQHLTYQEEQAFQFVMSVADGALSEVGKIAETLGSWRR